MSSAQQASTSSVVTAGVPLTAAVSQPPNCVDVAGFLALAGFVYCKQTFLTTAAQNGAGLPIDGSCLYTVQIRNRAAWQMSQ